MKAKLLLGGVFLIMLVVLGAALATRPTVVYMAPGAVHTGAASTATPTQQSAASYTLAQVAQHSSGSSCWAAINGNVYDLTNWINQHPGGPGRILALCGTDGSAAFNGQHGGQSRPASELAGFLLGPLAQ